MTFYKYISLILSLITNYFLERHFLQYLTNVSFRCFRSFEFINQHRDNQILPRYQALNASQCEIKAISRGIPDTLCISVYCGIENWHQSLLNLNIYFLSVDRSGEISLAEGQKRETAWDVQNDVSKWEYHLQVTSDVRRVCEPREKNDRNLALSLSLSLALSLSISLDVIPCDKLSFTSSRWFITAILYEPLNVYRSCPCGGNSTIFPSNNRSLRFFLLHSFYHGVSRELIYFTQKLPFGP